MRKQYLIPILAVTSMAGLSIATLTGIHPALAQNHPVMSNVIPDGGSGALRGKVQSVDPKTRSVMLLPESGPALEFFAERHVRLDDLDPGDQVEAAFMRSVAWYITAPSQQVPGGPAATVGEV